MEISKGEEKKTAIKELFNEIMAKSFPTLERDMDFYTKEIQRMAIRLNQKRYSPKHI